MNHKLLIKIVLLAGFDLVGPNQPPSLAARAAVVMTKLKIRGVVQLSYRGEVVSLSLEPTEYEYSPRELHDMVTTVDELFWPSLLAIKNQLAGRMVARQA